MTRDNLVGIGTILLLLCAQALGTYALIWLYAHGTEWMEQRAAQRKAQATVRAWWTEGRDFGLVDSRPYGVESWGEQILPPELEVGDDDACDGNDEGLVREAREA